MRTSPFAAMVLVLVALSIVVALRARPAEEAGSGVRPEEAAASGASDGERAKAQAALGAAPEEAVPGTRPLDEVVSEADGLLEVKVEESGRPVSRARVRLYLRGRTEAGLGEVDWRLAATGATGDDGRLVLPARPGAYLMVARAEGLAPVVREVVRPEDDARTRVVLSMEVGTALEVRAVGHGGEALPGVELTLAPHTGVERLPGHEAVPAEERVHGVGDAQGRVRFEGLAAGTYRVEAWVPGQARVARDVEVPTAGAVALKFLPASHVEGVVVGRDGAKAAGAVVMLVGGTVPTVVRADDTGAFSAEVEAGAWHVSARKGGEAGGVESPVFVGVGERVTGVEVRMAEGARVEGRVAARERGAPVVGAEVTVRPMGVGEVSGQAVTDVRGAFRVKGLAPGSYDVVVEALGHTRQVRRGVTVAAAEHFALDFLLEERGPGEELGKTVSREAPREERRGDDSGPGLTGLVLEPGGVPARGAQVAVGVEGEPVPRRVVSTDEEGRFWVALSVPGRRTKLRVLARHGARLGEVKGVTPGELTVQLRPAASLRGRVVGEGGKPVRGFSLEVAPGTGGVLGPFLFAEDRFALPEVPGERVRLHVRTEGGLSGEAEVELQPAARAEVVVTVRPGGALSGRLVDAVTKAPLREALLELDGRRLGREAVSTDGRFMLRDVTAGGRTLTIGVARYEQVVRRVRVESGKPLDLGDIALKAPKPRPGETGMELGQEGGKVKVAWVLPGGPAAQVKLREGDVLVAMDGVAVENVEQARERLRGAPGTRMTLTVRREESELTVRLRRASR